MAKNGSEPIYSFLTLEGRTEGLYKEKGSRFIAFACPVSSEEQIRTELDGIRKKFFDARHHCYAWVLGVQKTRFRANDDGEPNHSAGDPILGQIRARQLTNVLVVVVRYFGGTKLGVGGLMAAYKAAAEDALAKATIREEEVKEMITISYPYETTPEVMKMVKEFDLEIVEQSFKEDCQLTAVVAVRQKAAFVDKYTLLKALRYRLDVTWHADGVLPNT